MKNYFTAGKFAQMGKVTKQTLFHYDEIGLLEPEKRGSNGYRYYSVEQLEVLLMINTLKELDMPLADIRDYMKKRSPDHLEELLQKESVAVQKKIEELQWVSHYIRHKLRRVEEAKHVTCGQMMILDCKEERLLSTPYEGSDDKMHEAENVAAHVNYCHSRDVYSSYAVSGMVPVESVRNGKYRYSAFYTRIDDAGDDYSYVRPAGKYLTYYDPDGYRNIRSIAEKMLAYADENQLRIGDVFFEDAMLDALSGMTWDEYMVKLSVQVFGK